MSSCRLGVWQANADRKLLTDIIPPPVESQRKDGNGVNGFEIEATENGFVAYTLMPLDIDQIKKFSSEKNISEPDRFAEDILNTDSIIFAERPQDLIDLIAYWNQNGKLGKHEEMHRLNIENKLAERDPNRSAPSASRLLSGAQTLAAAVTFRKVYQFLLPDSPPSETLFQSSVVPRKVLRDWDSPEITSILAYPLFDREIYGTVGFHNRSAREYLTAQWLSEKLDSGKPNRAVEDLLFCEIYGLEVLVPSLAPIAAWLALWHPSIFARLLTVAPEVLLEHGDPSSFSVENRKQLLRCFSAKFKNRNRTSIPFDASMMYRIADEELSDTVVELLREHELSHDICVMLLKIAWKGKLAGVTDAAFNITINQNSDPYLRRLALKVVSHSGSDSQLDIVFRKIFSEEDFESIVYLVSDAVRLFYPSRLTNSGLLNILEKLEAPDRYKVPAINEALVAVSRLSLSDEDFLELIKGIHSLVIREPHLNVRLVSVSIRYAWLLQFFIDLSTSYFNNKSKLLLASETYGLVMGVSILKFKRKIRVHNDDDLMRKIAGWKRFSYKLFWYAVQQQRVVRGNRISYYWDVQSQVGQLWQPSAKFEGWLLMDMEQKHEIDDRLVALSALYNIYVQKSRPARLRKEISRLSKDNELLVERWRQLLNPPAISAAEQRSKAEDISWEKQQERRTKREEEKRKDWIGGLKKNPKQVRMIGNPVEGELIWNAIHLYEELKRDSDDSHSSFSYENTEALRKTFGSKVATNYRLACQDYWRGYDPFINADWRTNNQIPWARIVSLTGLALEAKYEPDWKQHLTAAEATNAAKLGMMEMNSFPVWYAELHSEFANEFESVLKEELKEEFLISPDAQYRTHVLRNLKYLDSSIQSIYKSFILELISSRYDIHHCVLCEGLEFLMGGECSSEERAHLAEVAQERLDQDGIISHELTWLILLFCIDAKRGLRNFNAILRKQVSLAEKKQYAVKFFALFGVRDDRIFRSNYRDYESAYCLRELVPLVYKYVRVEDDNRRPSGVVYSPDDRDDAEMVRSTLMQSLTNVPGRETYEVLMKLSRAIKKDYVLDLALQRARSDSEYVAWTDLDIFEFSQDGTKRPRNEGELYRVALSRLQDLKDELEEGDYSEAAVLRMAHGETDIRNVFVNRLRHKSYLQYVVTPEDELADQTRPDIRLHSAVVANAVPIELKVADNWTHREFLAQMNDQVVAQYMRQSKYGVFLLVLKGTNNRKYWRHSVTNGNLDFSALINDLQAYGDDLRERRCDVLGLKVIGIDLTKNISKQAAQTKTKAKTKAKTKRRPQLG